MWYTSQIFLTCAQNFSLVYLNEIYDLQYNRQSSRSSHSMVITAVEFKEIHEQTVQGKKYVLTQTWMAI